MCKNVIRLWALCAAVCTLALLLIACSPVHPLPADPSPITEVTEAAAAVTPAPTSTVDRWQEVRGWSPYPYTTPLPPAERTPLDGVYVRFDPRLGERTHCVRCPPYPPEGGVWKVEFDRGVFRVYHPRTGWRTLGSFAVEGDRVTLFNDPQCHLAVGEFAWQRDEEGLSFQLVADDCELGTRAKNFTAQPWLSCQPPNREAAVTGHWKAPEGCEP